MSTQASPNQAAETVNWTKFFVRMAILSAIFPVLLFLCAGELDWWMGWVYIVLVVGISVGTRYVMIRRNPEILEERSTAWSREDTKSWDKILAPISAIGPLAQLIVAGLDFRYDWSPSFASWIEWLGIVLVVIGSLFAGWAMLTNAFYSSGVRLQTERGQHVITDGPYRVVRHPSYLGLLVGIFGTSLVLSSVWSLVPAVFVMIAVVIRTALEDTALHHELPGYLDYAQKTRYLLLPGLW